MPNDALPDYYEDLQVSPNADAETIERVFRLLAKRYHPDNQDTGHAETFNRISTAYRVLSNDEQRASYDARHEAWRARKWKTSGAVSSAGSWKNDESLRHRILSILYVERRNDASGSGIGLWRLEQLLGMPERLLEFHVWYMKEKGWIQRTDNGGYAITARGVDAVEESQTLQPSQRLLPGPADRTVQTPAPRKVNSFERRSQTPLPNPA